MNYVSAQEVMASVKRLLISPVDEATLFEWLFDAFDAIPGVSKLEECVGFMSVKNGKAEKPKAMQEVVQLALNCCEGVTRTRYAEEYAIYEQDPSESREEALLKDPLAFFAPTPHLHWADHWGRAHADCFEWIRPSSYSFLRASVQTQRDGHVMFRDSGLTYRFDYPYFTFSFDSGQVAICYRRFKLGEDGLPLIPDHASVRQALKFYILWNYWMEQWQRGEQGAEGKYIKFERDWQYYCGQAANWLMLHSSPDKQDARADGIRRMGPSSSQPDSFHRGANFPDNITW